MPKSSSDRKKIFVVLIALALAVLFGRRLIIFSMGTWEYYHTDLVCLGRDPTPPEDLGDQFPFPLYEVGSYTVITDRGHMYSGDEYSVWGDSWSGSVTLLWAGRDGATFVVAFHTHNYEEATCRWFTPLGDYR